MTMIKRARRSGKIEEIVDSNTDVNKEALEDFNLQWNDVTIKDVLEVPTIPSANIDVDLDDDDDDPIAIRV
jgi:hypothetical protein